MAEDVGARARGGDRGSDGRTCSWWMRPGRDKVVGEAVGACRPLNLPVMCLESRAGCRRARLIILTRRFGCNQRRGGRWWPEERREVVDLGEKPKYKETSWLLRGFMSSNTSMLCIVFHLNNMHVVFSYQKQTLPSPPVSWKENLEYNILFFFFCYRPATSYAIAFGRYTISNSFVLLGSFLLHQSQVSTSYLKGYNLREKCFFWLPSI